ncbi:hypothetical protein H6G89_24210 [Oscillatoria sp. FACHB-1407]|uniref:hypothetical protein n=1 Tax=Oscillatoria sp. FACHB-1407 TaxID=2692847 RepID=UPI001688E96B|nr:hypothetical protein [Oscillatoria sp. FACHB-1407]MBD2464110.1 hypothetical protein [Oscillatoria sp. FACHB-1407]
MSHEAPDRPEQSSCRCLTGVFNSLEQIGAVHLDDRFAEVSIQICRQCGQPWLRYFYENEAFTASGRWYLAPLQPDELAQLKPENAKTILEAKPWYYCGGSYFDGRVSRTSGTIYL